MQGGSTSLTLQLLHEPLGEQDGELRHRRLPFPGAHLPLLRDVSQGEIDQLGGRLVAGEVPARFDDFSQLHVQRLDGVGGVDDLAHVRGVGEERNDFFPVPAPAGRDRWIFLAPRTGVEGIERVTGGLGVGRAVDVPQLGGERLAVLPARVVEAGADQVHDAGLNLGAREDGRDRLREALQAINHRDQDVVDAAVFKLRHDLEPELRPFGLFDPDTEDVLRPVGQDGKRQIDRFVLDGAFIADFDAQGIEEDHRVERLQRTHLPLAHFLDHRVGHGGNKVGRDLHAIYFLEIALDLAHAHAAGVHGDDFVVEAGETPLALGDDLRLEGAGAIARYFNGQCAVVGQDGLRGGPVAVVVLGLGLVLAPGVPQMVRQFRAQGAFEDGLLQAFQQVVDLAGGLAALQQFIEQLRLDIELGNRVVVLRHIVSFGLP